MELIFQERKQSCLCRILWDTVSQEQTADVIIPDSIPDADRVVDAFGTILVRSEECNGSGAEVRGVVQAGALIVDEGGTLYALRTELPFSARKEFPQPEEDCRMQCFCWIKSVDARLLNSRKLLIRVGLVCVLQAYSPRQITQYDLPAPTPNLQLRRRELPLRLPMGMGERSFTVNEELNLPDGRPAIARMLKCLAKMRVTEQRMVGSKAVFKGELTVHSLYEDTDRKLCTWQWTIPFSQYAQLEQELDDGDLQTFLTLTSMEAEQDSQFESRRLLVSFGLLAQCMTLGVQTVGILDDAFCTDGELKPRFAEWSMAGLLDRQNFRETALWEGEADVQRLVDVWAYQDEGIRQRTQEGMQLSQSMSCNLVYYDSQGALQGRTLRPQACVSTALAANGDCGLTQLVSGEPECSCNHGQVTLRVPLELTVDSTALQRIRAVCGASVEPTEGQEGRKPAVILRRTAEEVSVWELAKQYKTSVEAILRANGLEDDRILQDTMLLIPM